MTHRHSMILGSFLLGGILLFGLYGIGKSIASGRFERDHDDEHEYGHERSEYRWKRANPDPLNPQYIEECGSCHMAYPAGFLPQQSWQKIMAGLDDHFGENAELDDESRAHIETYLTRSTRPNSGNDRRMLRNMGDTAPLRITELAHFRHEHDEIPSRFIQGNEKVKSLSQCNACHQNAEKGWFDEDDVVIPDVGRWDD